MKQKEETFNITGAPIQSLGLSQKIASLTSTGPYKNLTDFLKVGPSILIIYKSRCLFLNKSSKHELRMRLVSQFDI
jgi:hypothetical protein